MPRYEFSEGKSNKFWEIELSGSSLVTRYGRIGTDGQSTEKSFGNPAAAQTQYDKLVAEKTKKGYALVSGGAPAKGGAAKPTKSASGSGGDRAKLEAAIAADPNDLGAWSVYGDFLQAAGDPRGELMAVQAALASKPKDAKLKKQEEALLKEHGATWLGELNGADDFACSWRMGFLDSASIGNHDEWGEIDGEAYFKSLMKTGSARFLRELNVGLFDTEDGTLQYGGLIRTMAKLGLPETLRALSFSCGGYQISWAELGDISPLYPQVPGLQKLEIKMGSMGLGKIKLPKLKHFEVITGGFTQQNMKSVSAAIWPELEHLELYFGDDNYGANCTVKDLASVLDGKGIPKVKHLGLCNSQFADDIAKALPKSKVVKQLKTLDLSQGMLTDAGAEALLSGADALKHLDALTLCENYVSDAMAAKLKKVFGKKIDVSSQGDPNDEYRSVQIAE